jgi:hypothetical protein
MDGKIVHFSTLLLGLEFLIKSVFIWTFLLYKPDDTHYVQMCGSGFLYTPPLRHTHTFSSTVWIFIKFSMFIMSSEVHHLCALCSVLLHSLPLLIL